MQVRMWLVVLPLVLAVGLVCGDAPSPLLDAHMAPSDTHIIPSRDLPCPVAEDIAPCVCTVRFDKSMDLTCSDVASEDQLAQIFSGHFPFLNFKELIINFNQNLKILQSGVFGEVTFQGIYITNGQLEEVQEGALSGSFTTATSINVGGNNITNFPFIELENYSQLQRFFIYSNNIQDFPSLKSSTLSELRFNNNPLTNLPATALWDLPNLSICYFNGAGISQIEPGTFKGFPHLKRIYFEGNTIQHLPTGAIQLNDQITDAYVQLHNNRISSIGVGAVTGLKQGELWLQNNLLEELDEAVFRPIFNDGNRVSLSGNPLNCGCDIAWIITNNVYMNQLNGYETCYDGEKLTDLDPQIYEQNC